MVPRFITHHDTVVEGVEFKVAILPSLLLPLDVVGEETSEFGDWCSLRRGEGGGVGRASERGGHCAVMRVGHVLFILCDMGAIIW